MKTKQAVLFAGGKGTRLSEKTDIIPKPLVEVQGEPIIVHIMRQLRKSGIKEFIILTGHLSECFTEYFLSRRSYGQELIEFTNNGTTLGFNIKDLEDCKIKLFFTGQDTGTASRLWKAKDLLDDSFVLTYGDTFGDVDMTKVEEKFLKNKDTILTLTGVPYRERFGLAYVDDNGDFKEFKEKSVSQNELVNGGFMIINKKIFDYYKNVQYPEDFMKDIMSQEELISKTSVYKHNGYWKAVDTMKDLENINEDFKSRRF